MKEKNENHAAELLRGGKKLSAAWLQAGSAMTAEILAEAGFDILIVDLEHGPGDIMTLIGQIQAMKGEKAVPFARASWNDMVQIKRILDAGAYGLVIPYVCSRMEAEAAVRAAKYPPQGVRGIAGSARAAHYGNASAEYFETANRDVFVFVQIESPEGVRNLDEILMVEGVDGIYLGPNDLATTHGFRGDPGAPQMRPVFDEIERKIKASGKVMATVSTDFADAKAKFARGYGLVSLVHDTTALSKLGRDLVAQFEKEVLPL